jgi:hypothetical protein
LQFIGIPEKFLSKTQQQRFHLKLSRFNRAHGSIEKSTNDRTQKWQCKELLAQLVLQQTVYSNTRANSTFSAFDINERCILSGYHSLILPFFLPPRPNIASQRQSTPLLRQTYYKGKDIIGYRRKVSLY